MNKKILVIVTTLFLLSFSSLVFASGNWECTILPNTLKELSSEEADRALPNYHPGLLLVPSPYSSQSGFVNSKKISGALAIFKQTSTNSYELAVSPNLFGKAWVNREGTINFAHVDKVVSVLTKPDADTPAVVHEDFFKMMDGFVKSSQKHSARIFLLDSLSSVTDKQFCNIMKNDKFRGEYTDCLTSITVAAFKKNIEVTVLLDPVYNEATYFLSDDKKKVVIVMPFAYGEAGSKGARITSTNGTLSVQMFDTSQL